MEYVVGVANTMLAGVVSAALPGSVTVPVLTVALPVFVAAALAVMAEAAAIFDGLVSTTLKFDAVVAVGWIKNVSFAAGVPVNVMEMPSAVSGFAAVPVPVRGTFVPSVVASE
jgi:hypothetical protein